MPTYDELRRHGSTGYLTLDEALKREQRRADETQTIEEPPDLPAPRGELGSSLLPRLSAAAGEQRLLPAERFPLVPWDQVKLDTAPAYLIKGFLPSVGLTIIWGEAKSGKTFWTLDLIAHVAAGREYRGQRVKQGCVVYCALEGKQRIATRIEALKQNSFPEMVADAFQVMTAPLALISDHQALIAAIHAQLKDLRPATVVIDTLNRSIVGSESDDEVMTAYIRATDAIRDAFDCAVIVVHHCGYGGDRPRGHSSQLGAYDALVAVTRDAAGYIVATLEGSKDGAAGLQFVSKLKEVEVGTDDEGDAITTCIIEPVEGGRAANSAAKPAKAIPPRLRLLMELVTEATIEAGVTIQPFADGRAVKAVHDALVRERLYARIAEKADPGESHKKLYERQRKNFNGPVANAIKAKQLMAATHNGERFLWIP